MLWPRVVQALLGIYKLLTFEIPMQVKQERVLFLRGNKGSNKPRRPRDKPQMTGLRDKSMGSPDNWTQFSLITRTLTTFLGDSGFPSGVKPWVCLVESPSLLTTKHSLTHIPGSVPFSQFTLLRKYGPSSVAHNGWPPPIFGQIASPTQSHDQLRPYRILRHVHLAGSGECRSVSSL